MIINQNILTKSRLAYLDGLRGISALIVVFSHIILIFYPSLYTGNISTNHGLRIENWYAFSILNILTNGDYMVCIFFVLSGYVLGKKYTLNNQVEELISGIYKRYIRLMIPILVTVIGVYFLHINHLIINKETSGITNSIDWLSKLFKIESSNLFSALFDGTIGVLFNGNTKFNNVLWSVKIEFWGSLIVYLLWLCFHYYKITAIYIWILCFLVLPFIAETYYLGLLLGMLILYFENEITKILKTKFVFISLIIVAIILGSIPNSKEIPETSIYYLFFMGIKSHSLIAIYHIIAASLTLILVLNSNYSQVILKKPIMIFLGKISFPLYLLHLPFLCSFTSLLFLKLHMTLSYHTAIFISLIISLPILLLLSLIFTHIVDNTSITLSKFCYLKSKQFFIRNIN